MTKRSLIGMCGLLAANLAGCAVSDVTAPRVEAGPGSGVANDYVTTSKYGVTISYTVDANIYDHYWFSANQDNAGRVTGNFLLWELRLYNSSAWAAVGVWGRVVCMNVTANKARLGGVVTYSTFSGIPVGSSLTWSVTDNGAKGASSDDTASAMYGGVDPYAYCAGGLPYPETTAMKGGVTLGQ